MAREFFKNLPSQETPFNASRWNGLLNGEEAMGSIVVDDVTCKNILDILPFNNITKLGLACVVSKGILKITGLTTSTVNINIPFKFSEDMLGKNYTFSVRGTWGNISNIGFKTSSGDAVVLNNIGSKTFTVTQEMIDNVIKLDIYIGSNKTVNSSLEIQLEKGSVATDYVEHKEYENKIAYSTNEQVIGTWIDGKPLYRKVITNISIKITNYDTPEYTDIPLPSNIKEVFLEYADVYISSANNRLSLPYIFSNGKFMRINSLNATKIMVENPTSYAGVGTFIVRYTKTTD